MPAIIHEEGNKSWLLNNELQSFKNSDGQYTPSYISNNQQHFEYRDKGVLHSFLNENDELLPSIIKSDGTTMYHNKGFEIKVPSKIISPIIIQKIKEKF
mgnify:FL=1